MAGKDNLHDLKHLRLRVGLVFALGIVVGMIVNHFWEGRGSGPPAEQVAIDPPSAPTGATTPPPPAAPASTPPATFGNAPAGAMPPAVEVRPPEYTGYQQSIDVGPVFRQQFETAEANGLPDAVAAAHRELEREVRDDSWAYAIEAEIENSLIAETSLGNFRREHVECRATMCEIRLYGEGDDQTTAIQNWNENLGGKPWSARVVISSSATISDNGKVSALMIFRRVTPETQGR
jgi:hypothetical protein